MKTSNKVIPLHTINTIDDQASIWLVRLDDGNLSVVPTPTNPSVDAIPSA